MDIISEMYYGKLFRDGNIHIGMDLYIKLREHSNSLYGSILNWLELNPSSIEELLDDVAIYDKYICEKYDSEYLESFYFSLLGMKIGEPVLGKQGSYCLASAYSIAAFNGMFEAIISKYKIPITERDIPPYPELAKWIEEGLCRDVLQEVEELKIDTETEKVSEEKARRELDIIFEKAKKDRPIIEAFKDKVTEKCEVCKMMVDIFWP